MFESLQNSFNKIVHALRGEGIITQENIAETLRQVRRSLLEADVNYKVVKDFIQNVQNKAIGLTVTKSLTPGQLFIKIINDELTLLLGQKTAQIKEAGIPPTIVMLVGLQGTGKTTTAAKLAYHFKNKSKDALLVPLDLKRPAATEQLVQLAQKHNLKVFCEGEDPFERARKAVEYSRKNHIPILILDTAGRLQIDKELMNELMELKLFLKPQNILFVADGMTGQDAVNIAQEFNNALGLDGIILTKMDSDTRGGAALSIVAVTGKPIHFIGVGEKIEDLEVFHPDRIASRILGMGDVVSLVEKVQAKVSQEEAERLVNKLTKNKFDLEDLLLQIRQLKKLGPIENLLTNIPGMGRLIGKNALNFDNRELIKAEAIILSMTKEERRNPSIINGSRRKRIAKGSGTTVNDVNRLLNQYYQMLKMTKQFSKMRLPKNFAFFN